MERQTKKVFAWSAFGVGAGGILYAADKLGWLKWLLGGGGGSPSNYVLTPSATFFPALKSPYPLGPASATVTWTNPSQQTVMYGVQGWVVANGAVNGHWWSSLQAAEAALAASRKGGIAALAPYVSNIADRVVAVSVAPGRQGKAVLYEQFALPETEQWIILVKPNYTGGMIASDPQGAPAGGIAPAGVPGVTATVTVG